MLSEDQFMMLKLKGMGQFPRLCYKFTENFHFATKGVHFFKVIKDPWMKAFSRKIRKLYYFNRQTNTSTFEIPQDSFASYKNCLDNRLYWTLEDSQTVTGDKHPITLLKDMVLNFKNNKERV